MEEDMVPMEINLSDGDKLEESFIAQFGTAVKMLLRRMFGAYAPPVKVKGKKSDVRAFTDALSKEKKYMESFRDYGLDDPKTYKSKAQLKTSVSKFERKTGLEWPFQ